jgi:hypothetical protein
LTALLERRDAIASFRWVCGVKNIVQPPAYRTDSLPAWEKITG